MAGAAMMKLRGNYAVRTTRKAKLPPARPYSMKPARISELRLSMQLVPHQQRHQVPILPVELELGEVAEKFEQLPSLWPVRKSPRKRTRRHVARPRAIKPNDEHKRLPNQQQSSLPESTWCMIQDMITNAKSLGDITRITLTFFKEHETAQTLASIECRPAFPIVIPASEVYNMLVPRKRRIYDVLHVLEGIGVIRRVRGDEAAGTKGGSFLYFGKEAAIQHIGRIQQEANQTVERLNQRRLGTPSAEEVDAALLKMCEDLAEVERWPCLTTTTTSFLSLLLQQDITQALALPGISSRLVGAKKNRDPNFTNETAYADVNRRVYDVVSVLASCNLVLISVAPGTFDDQADNLDKISSRKHVRFNHMIFDDSSSLRIADVSARKLSSRLQNEKLHVATSFKQSKTLIAQKKQSRSKKWKSSARSRLSFTEAELPSDEDTPTDTAIGDGNAPAKYEMPLRIDLSAISAYSGGDYSARHIQSPPHKSLQPIRDDLRLKLFFPIIKSEDHRSCDWWDESLQELLFQDALPSHDLSDWEQLMFHKTNEEGGVWGRFSSDHQPHQHAQPSAYSWINDYDLKCYEEFVDDDDAFTDSFFTL